jgi:hypothetical protein
MGTQTLFEFLNIQARRSIIPQTNYSIAIIPLIHELASSRVNPLPQVLHSP